MSFLGNLKIGTRLGLGFGVLALLIGVLGGLTLWKTERMTDSMDYIVKSRLPVMQDLAALKDEANIQARSTRNTVLFAKPEEIKGQRDEILGSRKKVDELFARLDKFMVSEKAKPISARMKDLRGQFRAGVDGFFALVDQGKKDEAIHDLLYAVRPVQRKYFDAIEEMITLQSGYMAKAGDEAGAAASEVKLTVWTTAGIALMLAVLIALWIIRSITRPLNEAVAVAQKVAAGDLTSVVEIRSKDETGVLLQALKDMNESLVKIVGEVRSGSEAIGSGTKQIASGNADLSQRTEEQASSLEETASSMEELTSTVKQNAENAKQANQLALGASAVAVQGGAVVGQVVETMSSINESSKKIVDIISVIDGIAFQTNILALNAAVEAARAGEQGRGFAVVASEVRNLAQRSAAAAKEIKALIGDSVDKVGAGTKLVDEAGKTMQEIVTSVKRVTDIMSEITAASQEQSSGIEQVNQAITQMDEVTQQNAALVEEAAAAAESLEEQAQNLEVAVAVFKLARGSERTLSPAKADKPVANVTHLPAKDKAAKGHAAAARKPVAAKLLKVANAKQGEGAWEEF